MAERTGRVLVVDDTEAVREVVADALTEEGYEVRSAADGRAALEVLENWRPDVIVLDLLMPRMDGRAFRAEQRKRPALRGIPVLLVSASRGLEKWAAELGVAAALESPFDLQQLIEAVGRLARLAPRDGGAAGGQSER